MSPFVPLGQVKGGITGAVLSVAVGSAFGANDVLGDVIDGVVLTGRASAAEPDYDLIDFNSYEREVANSIQKWEEEGGKH